MERNADLVRDALGLPLAQPKEAHPWPEKSRADVLVLYISGQGTVH